MRLIKVAIEIHLYSGGQLHDDEIEKRKQGYGLYSPGFYKRVLRFNNKEIKLQIEDGTTLGAFCNLINRRIGSSYAEDLALLSDMYFLIPGAWFSVGNPDSDFGIVMDKYLDPELSGRLRVGVYICEDAGTFDRKDNLTYRFHSHENGEHNEPHVHVYYKGDSKNEPISIRTGDVLTKHPKMPMNYQKQAKRYIQENQLALLNYWNAKTDGLDVDINHILGLNN